MIDKRTPCRIGSVRGTALHIRRHPLDGPICLAWEKAGSLTRVARPTDAAD